MPNSIHWRAIDPLDLQADEWFVDPLKFRWHCNVDVEQRPRTDDAMNRFREDLAEVKSVDSCNAFRALWSGTGLPLY